MSHLNLSHLELEQKSLCSIIIGEMETITTLHENTPTYPHHGVLKRHRAYCQESGKKEKEWPRNIIEANQSLIKSLVEWKCGS